MARRFTLEGAKVLAIEKSPDLLDGASKGNSAILHSGFDAPPGSIEHACIMDGHAEYLRIRARLNLPLLKTGALVLAWSPDEAGQLDALLARAHANGISHAKRLSAAQIRAREPHLSRAVNSGIDIPTEGVIDPWSAPYAYALQAAENGAELLRCCALLRGEFDGREWRLTTTRAELRATTVINCAGLHGDQVDVALIGRAAFRIRPRKGQFLVYDKSASRLIHSILLPLPTEASKGVVVCRTVFGNVLVGPSSENQDSRQDTSVQTEVLRALRRQGERFVPALARHSITATYAGIRPATEFKDYCIRAYADRNYFSVGGIRSTGLSAALGIARYVFDQYTGFGHRHAAPANCVWPSVNSLSEHQPRDWQAAGNGGIVCHCELVTRREIDQALHGKMPVASLGGLKRRTRAAMGRCQGFYCHARLSELTQGIFAEEMVARSRDA
ncbi:MAG: NAD(P)/FAD-dependent oxidoreductase [bacterium]